MLEYLFGTPTIEKILFYLLINQKCYPSQLKTIFKGPVYNFQRSLSKLERGGILVSYLEGKTRVYTFNPRYVFLPELKDFIKKAYEFIPNEIKEKYYEPIIRKRPRRQGKPL